jgi:hypothetical protein
MAIVENNIVKMEWDKKGWLQTSARGGKQPVFILASKDYESSTHGTLSVIFTAETAFLFIDNADIWSAEDLIDTIKADMPGLFPYSLTQYVPIIDSGEAECKIDVLEKYGLTEYKDDIEKRQMDVAPYGEEKEVKIGG